MFKMFKKEKKSQFIYAPVTGKLMPLEDIQDQVFSSGMMGKGLAINPQSGLFVAPGDGEIILIPETKHAFAMRLDNGIEILIHIGLDTALNGGKGFEVLLAEGEVIKAGTPVIKADLEFFKDQKCIMETPIIIIDDKGYQIEFLLENTDCVEGKTEIVKI